MRRYYLTTITGKGTRADPFRPAVADYAAGGEWGMLDLREDSTAAAGLAVAYADTPAPINAAGVTLLGDDLKAPLTAPAKQAFTGALGVTLADDSLPGMLAELLSIRRPGFCAPIRKMADGRMRIFLGGLIYGDPPPEYGKGTFTESFNKADSSTLGPDLTWEEWDGTGWQVKSNQGYHSGVSDEVASPTNTNATDDFYTQFKIASWTSKPDMDVGVLTRAYNSPRYWYGAFAQFYDNTHTFEKMVNNSWTLVATISTAVSTGETLYLSSDGSSHIVKKNGSQIWSGTDSSVVNYYRAGMAYHAGSSGAQVYVDDFESADLTTAKTSADTGAGADASVSYPTAALTPVETGAGTEATLSRGLVFPESGSGADAEAEFPAAALAPEETATGLDAKTDYPAATLSLTEAGTGTDEEADYPEAALRLDETGAGVDAGSDYPAAILALAETGTGLDAEADYPAAVLSLAEAGAGEEILLARILDAVESGPGLDSIEVGNPLADWLASESGDGIDAIIALVQSIAVVSGDNGLGEDSLAGLLAIATFSDGGFAADALISRWLDITEIGSGLELALQTAAVTGAGESGSGAETSYFLPALLAGDGGIGAELIFILKDIIGADGGMAIDRLNKMMETAGSSADLRLHSRAGRADSAGDNRQAQRRQGQARLPSKEVDL